MRFSAVVRRAALAAAAGIGTVGVMSGVLLLGPLAASVLLGVVFVLVWPAAAAIRHVADDASFESPLLVACLVAGGVLCVPGLIRLLTWGAAGVLTAAIAALLFAVIDLVITRLVPRRSLRRRRRSPYGRLVQLSVSEPLDEDKLTKALHCPLSTEELCSVWGETTTALQQGAGLRDRETVAEVRRICLDEFERRNPDGFRRWIEAGAPADPSSYLLPEPEDK